MSFVADRVDAALDWSLVGSFTRVGSALRRRLDHWAPLDERSLAGRVVVMTLRGFAAPVILPRTGGLGRLRAVIEGPRVGIEVTIRTGLAP